MNVADVIDASSTNDCDWFEVSTNTLKKHFVHKCLLPSLLVDLEVRDGVVVTKATNYCPVEFGRGLMLVGRPMENVKIDVLHLCMPSKDIGEALDTARKLEVREFSDGKEYFKFKHSWNCVVFTTAQYTLFVDWLKRVYTDADLKDARFVANWKKQHLGKFFC